MPLSAPAATDSFENLLHFPESPPFFLNYQRSIIESHAINLDWICNTVISKTSKKTRKKQMLPSYSPLKLKPYHIGSKHGENN